MTKYPKLFSTYTIRNTTFRNRIFCSPSLTTWPDYTGAPNEAYLYDIIDKARGGVAVITLGETNVNRSHSRRGCETFLSHSDGYPLERVNNSPTNAYAKITAAISRHGALPSIQLFHAGEAALTQLSQGRGIYGPTARVLPDGTEVQAMDLSVMEEVCRDFEEAAKTAQMCGFRIIQLHGAHGWLLSQFLSPLTNHRTDEFGGSLENRARFPQMVIDAVRRGIGSDMIIEYRISGDEHMKGGMQIEEVAEFLNMVKDRIDIAHISAGSYWSAPQYTFPTIYQPRGINTKLAAFVKKRVDVPVTVVGGFGDPAQMEKVIDEGKADFIAVARALIADPELPNKAYWGKEEEIRPCIRCSNCLGLKYFGHNNCDVNPIACNGLYIANSIKPVEDRRRVLVIGGGPGGLMASATAGGRGHEVILIEKSDKLGGLFKHTDLDPNKKDLKCFKDYLIRQVYKNSVDVRLNTEGSPALLDEIKPNFLIVATGSRPIVPKFQGMDQLHSLPASEVYERLDETGKKVVVVGGGMVGCETALFLADKNREVTLIEMLEDIANDSNRIYYSALKEQLDGKVNCLTRTRCLAFTKDGVVVADKDGKESLMPCDTALLAVGMKPNREDVETLREKFGFGHFRDIGDCYKVETVRQAIHQGYFAAMDII
jgi:2,4-dienoyl-CoA reductase-like NADH-dependent reductase (Old Yellow Enzyme family)/thioredoxin reductase